MQKRQSQAADFRVHVTNLYKVLSLSKGYAMVRFSNRDFPEIKDFTIVIREPNPGVPEGSSHDTRNSIVMPSDNASVSYVRCANSGCTGEGYDILGLVQAMAEKREEEQEGEMVCLGKNADDSPCMQVAKYKASITYKDA